MRRAQGVKKKVAEVRLTRWRKAFAAVLAASRRDADLAQWQVAEEMGWGKNTLSSIERAEMSVSAEELMELCRIYKVDPITLLGRVVRW